MDDAEIHFTHCRRGKQQQYHRYYKNTVDAAEFSVPHSYASPQLLPQGFDTVLRAITNPSLRKVVEIIVRKNEFPTRQREETIERLADTYLDELGNDIHEMITNQDPGDDYRGLDHDRDNIDEIRTAIHFCPDVLARRKSTMWDSDLDEWVHTDEGEYPIMCLESKVAGDEHEVDDFMVNWKALPFITGLAQLAIEHKSFDETDRGGLLTLDRIGKNVLFRMVENASWHSDPIEHTRIMTELIQWRQLYLFRKEDIQEYELLHNGCIDNFTGMPFRTFLIEWDPSCLCQTNEDGCLLLHVSISFSGIAFQDYFEYCIRYYPTKRGICLLFQMDHRGETPFQKACSQYKKEEVMAVVEQTLARYSHTTPIDIMGAILLAATDERIHHDCVYFLFRFLQPDIPISHFRLPPHSNSDVDHDGSLNVLHNQIIEGTCTTADVNTDHPLRCLRNVKNRKRKR